MATPAAADAGSEVTVRILGFSDYHSHALPFYSEARPDQAGIARAIAWIRQARAAGDALVLSGGDMLNRGAPAWSDAFGCVEWPWLNGLVDAMALGNHDVDYGWDAFEACRRAVSFPVLSANLLGWDGQPVLGPGHRIFERAGVRIGVFAVGGPDMPRLVRPERLPRGARWSDATHAARAAVAALRRQGAAAVILIGHLHREAAEQLARSVPGIDLILGSHSHDKTPFQRIPGTDTHYVSAFQYLSYVSDVRLAFRDGTLARTEGRLLRLDETLPPDPRIAAEVARLDGELRQRQPELFEQVGAASVPLGDANVQHGESTIGNWATEVVRRAAGAHVFFATASSFRAGLPPGPIDRETFVQAFPYPNAVRVATLSGALVLEWLQLSESLAGSGGYSQQTGLRFERRRGKPWRVRVLADPRRREAGYVPLDPEAHYVVATTDYQAETADGYRDVFALGRRHEHPGIDVREALLAALAAGPVAAACDGRAGPVAPGTCN